jgi:translation elongation factor P/translation initiation factor 5A
MTKKEILKIFKKYIYQDGDIYVFYSRRSLTKIISEILELNKSKLTDSDIDTWAHGGKKYIYQDGDIYVFYDPGTTERTVGRYEGAKAMRDNEIKHIGK